MLLDHIAIGCESLEDGCAWVEAALGVRLRPGGQHERFGTHNRLLGLGEGRYLEVIAIDPEAPHIGPRWFGLDSFAGAPRLVNWICATGDLDADLAAAPVAAGRALALERGDLKWRIAVPEDGSLPLGGGYPTLIEWAAGTHHPSDRLGTCGVRLLEWTVRHPEAEMLRAALAPKLAGAPVTFEVARAPAFRARFSTPKGEVLL